MDDDEFNYEPDDLNSEPKEESLGKAEEKNIFDNEEKEKIYKFEDIEEIDAGEQKRILDEIQAKNANNKKEESKKDDNIFDLISEHNNGGNNEQINEKKQDNTNEDDIDIEKYLDNNVQIKKENELVSQEDKDIGFDDNIDELIGELNENDKEKDTKKQDHEKGKQEDDIEEIHTNGNRIFTNREIYMARNELSRVSKSSHFSKGIFNWVGFKCWASNTKILIGGRTDESSIYCT